MRPVSPGTPFGALAGLEVVDLSRVLGGPYCTQILGDHGAAILKVEPPHGDETRDWGPPFHEGDASYYIGVNRNKRAMALDLSREEGRAVLLRLLEGADVLLENYRPGTMEKWGLGYRDVLRKRYPTLIHARISGFGSEGAYGGFPGYDAVVQAMSGMFSVNGTQESGPTRLGIALVDMGTGLYTALGILMAVIERQRSGLGQYLDMTLYDSAIALMHPHVSNYYLSGRVPGLTGNAHPNLSPYDKFRTRTTEIFVAAGNNRAFSRLCSEIGVPGLAQDPRFRDNRDRLAHPEALRDALEAALAEVDGFALCERLLKAGLPAGPVMDTREVMSHPHTATREMAVELDWYRGSGTPIKMSRTPGEVRRTPPAFGAHAREILSEHGYSEEDIEALVRDGVVPDSRRT